jgi:hypothetical protein
MFLGVRWWDPLFYQFPATDVLHIIKTRGYQEMHWKSHIDDDDDDDGDVVFVHASVCACVCEGN